MNEEEVARVVALVGEGAYPYEYSTGEWCVIMRRFRSTYYLTSEADYWAYEAAAEAMGRLLCPPVAADGTRRA